MSSITATALVFAGPQTAAAIGAGKRGVRGAVNGDFLRASIGRAGLERLALCDIKRGNGAAGRTFERAFHLHRLDHRDHFAFAPLRRRGRPAVSTRFRRRVRSNQVGAFGDVDGRSLVRRILGEQITDPVELARGIPRRALGIKSRLTRGFESGDAIRIVTREKRALIGEPEGAFLDPDRASAIGEIPQRQYGQFFRRDRVEADLVEKKRKQLWLAIRQRHRFLTMRVPHLNRAPEQLVAARPLHHRKCTYRRRRSPPTLGAESSVRAGCICGDEPVARIDRGGHRSAKVNIAQPENEIARIEDQILDRLRIGQTVDAAD